MTGRHAALLLGIVLAFAMGGCSAALDAAPVPSNARTEPAPSSSAPSTSPAPGARGDAATWVLVEPAEIGPDTTEVRVAATRLGCAGGRTGELRGPWVSYREDEVVIEVDAEPLGDGAFECPGNDAVEVVVTLTEPLGDRSLVDGACLEGEAVTTAACAEGPVRWP